MLSRFVNMGSLCQPRWLALVGALLLAGGLAVWTVWPTALPPPLRIHFLDVGQGDAVLVADQQARILIDGGPDRVVLAALGQALPFGDRRLTWVAATHPHDDHTAGLVGVLERYLVSQLLLPAAMLDHPEFARLHELAADTATPVVALARGDRLRLSGQSVLTVLWPPVDCVAAISGTAGHSGNHDPINSCSLVLRLDHCDEQGCRRALFMGDATTATEERLLALGESLQANLLKIGHHGSRYSTLPDFVAAVGADQAVIQVGSHNRFGHPDYGVWLRLQAAGATVYRTDRHGTVVASPAENGFRLDRLEVPSDITYSGANDKP